MHKIFKNILSFCVLTTLCLTFASPVWSQGALIPGAGKDCNCQTIDDEASDCYKYCKGDYGINDIWQIVANWANRIYGLIGSIVLIMFIYGGFVFLTSAGSKERVTKGKDIIVRSIIGMAIIFLSYTIIGFVFSMLGVPGGENFYSTGWFK